MSAALPEPRDLPTSVVDEAPGLKAPGLDDSTPWQRLPLRLVAVDTARLVLALAPVVVLAWTVGGELSPVGLWPIFALAAFQAAGVGHTVLRWAITRYRVTDEHLELRTGVFVRRHRSVRRDRIRSVDTEAKLHYRLANLRVVTIGAGQQMTAGEAALALDGVSRQDAEHLRELLMPRGARRAPAQDVMPGPATDDASAREEALTEETEVTEVFARFRPQWVIYNIFSIWAYAMALGLLGGLYGFNVTFGLNVVPAVRDAYDWEALGWGWVIAIGVLTLSVVGMAGLAGKFFTSNWAFELARVPGEHGTALRTRQGLFQTREVNRDDRRVRGIQISEPALWRWMGMADTSVITTGLSLSSASQPATILPRGPLSVARPVAAGVLGLDPSPLEAPLRPHPRAALRRRIGQAVVFTVAVATGLAVLVATDVAPPVVLWALVGLGPLALGAAVVAYRALGHAIVGDYLVVRSGLLDRATTALLRPAVSTIVVRESLLQRRLGLKTVVAMTAAGEGAYEAPDLAADEAITFATEAAPGLLAPFFASAADAVAPAHSWRTS